VHAIRVRDASAALLHQQRIIAKQRCVLLTAVATYFAKTKRQYE